MGRAKYLVSYLFGLDIIRNIQSTLAQDITNGGLDKHALTFLKSWGKLPADHSATFSHTYMNDDGGSMNKTELGDEIVEQFGAYCLDGSPFSYYFRPASSDASSNKWVIYLEGGGLCIERVDCEQRVNQTDGSSKDWEPYLTKSDNVLSSSSLNPFYDWNHIYMRYCSGDTWTGTNIDAPGRYGLYFSGHNVIEATIYHLNVTKGLFADSENNKTLEILHAGASAGGIGTNNNCDYVADIAASSVSETAPKPIVRCSPQSGMFFPPDVTTEYEVRLGISASVNKIAALYLAEMYSSFLDESCVAYAKSVGDPIKYCWEASYLTPHISTKMLIAQNFWDSCQLDTILCYQDDLNGCPDDYMAMFRNHTITQLVALSSNQLSTTKIGVWSPSCLAHTGDTCIIPKSYGDYDATAVQGHFYRDALAAWILDDENPPVYIDDCNGLNSDSHPCNSNCQPGCAGDQ
jgi:O-palmitoleoyl-L-serine hydrolase